MTKFLTGNEAIQSMILMGEINDLEAEIEETKNLKSADYIYYVFKKYRYFTKSKKQHLFGQKRALEIKKQTLEYLKGQFKEIKVAEPVKEKFDESVNIVDMFLNPQVA